MSPSHSRSSAGSALAASADDHSSSPASGDEGLALPCVNAQRGQEASLRLVDCSGARRDEEVPAAEEVLNPYAAPVDGEADAVAARPGGWWKSSALAVALHLGIVAGLIWLMPAPSELNLGQGELPKAMQVSVVQLAKKPEPVQQPPAAAPDPQPAPPQPQVEPPKPEPPKPRPKPAEKALPKVAPKPKPKPTPQPDPEPAEEARSATPTPSTPPPPAAPVSGQTTAGAQSAPTAAQGPAGLPTGSLNDSDIKPLRMDSPSYPPMAQRRGIEGHVKVLFTITAEGRIEDIQVLESWPPRLFDSAVSQAMAKWRFEPRVSGGRIVARQATKVFFFKLEGRR